MRYSKSITIVLATVVCATVVAADVAAQGRSRGGARSGGGRGPSVGRAVPRGGGGGGGGGGRVVVRGDRGRSYGSRVIVAPRVVVGAPLRSYYYPYYGYGYRYPYRYGRSVGFYGRYGYPYGYGYPYYGYPYGYSYGGYYPAGYGYGGYGYGGYGSGGYGYRGDAYGGVRIQGAVRNAEVYVDGYYAGVVDDFDGAFQRIELESGTHQIEIRAPGFPPLTYDVNVQPGQTLTIHANVR
jgi:carboxypeptidase family protein